MNRPTRCARTATVLAALTLTAMSTAVPFAAASGPGVPFKDTNIDGSLTLCGRNGQPLTSGSLDSAPFVWKTISSAPAPAQFRAATARATLAAYQPLKYVDPSDWSGGQLTGSSSYTNSDHPVVQATNGDSPLLDFVQAYPPHWQGLVEIRMLFSGTNLPQHIAPYPAAIVRITGTKWTLVSGGGGSCREAQGVSDESRLLPKKRLASPEAVVPAGASSTSPSRAGRSSTKSSAGSSAASSSGSSSGGDESANLAAESSSTGMSNGAKTGIGLGVVAVIGLFVVAILWWRRRPLEGQ
jgi:hypothetical protein